MGQSQLYLVASIIGIIVIIAMAACFGILFFLYTKQRCKIYRVGAEDENVSQDLEEIKVKYLKKHEEEENIYAKSLEHRKKKSHAIGVIGDVIYGIIIVIALALAGFGIYLSATNQPLFINDTSYLVIMTGSMEDKNPENDYLIENDLDDQITQYSLIGIDKIDSIDEIELYDIIAFYDSDENIIVHRVIAIREEEGIKYIQTQGDANTGSINDEIAITEDRIIGIYDGYQNYGLGITITYLRSTLGIIALCGFGVFLLVYSISESNIDKAYEERLEYLAIEKDKKPQLEANELPEENSEDNQIDEEQETSSEESEEKQQEDVKETTEQEDVAETDSSSSETSEIDTSEESNQESSETSVEESSQDDISK